MLLVCVSSAGLRFFIKALDSFKYLGILKQNVNQSTDKLNILDTFDDNNNDSM